MQQRFWWPMSEILDFGLLPWDIQPHCVGSIMETLKDQAEILWIPHKQGIVVRIVVVGKHFLTNPDCDVWNGKS